MAWAAGTVAQPAETRHAAAMNALPLLALAGLLAAAEPTLGSLPALPRSRPATAAWADVDEGTLLAPGVRLVPGQRVVLAGRFHIDQGPPDGLEVLACMPDGKLHEALIKLDATSGAVINAAAIAAFGPVVGAVPAEEGQGIPARGLPVRVVVQWQPADRPGEWRSIDASCLVRDRSTDRAFPPLPYVLTGSRTVEIFEPGPDGKPAKRSRFMLDVTKSVAVNYDEADALLASPFPDAATDNSFETTSSLAPPPGTQAWLSISRAELPLALALDGEGRLLHDGRILDDAALDAALAATFGAGAQPGLRALAVAAPAATGPQLVAARKRLIASAARAKAWAIPVFTPGR